MVNIDWTRPIRLHHLAIIFSLDQFKVIALSSHDQTQDEVR